MTFGFLAVGVLHPRLRPSLFRWLFVLPRGPCPCLFYLKSQLTTKIIFRQLNENKEQSRQCLLQQCMFVTTKKTIVLGAKQMFV
jgi:hypothetical protein